MASLTRAYGIRGAAVALAMAAVAGGVHGTMAAAFDVLALKIGVGVAGSLVLIIGGAISARRTMLGAIGTALAMAAAFVALRWGAWALMTGGAGELVDLLTTPPWHVPAYLEARGISQFWMVEAISMLVPALIGCLVGQERAAAAPTAAPGRPPRR